MGILLFLILFSLGFYVYYKIKYIRSNNGNEKKWLSAKSSIALGLFVGFFGLNRLFISQSTVSIVIGIIFLLVGTVSVWTGFKAYKFYTPYVMKDD
ncbi:YtpI family protein [Fervidibacillus halotolerans]|uniref:YtpI family protein n=1 Tax=Fervidibacillus halotolerans TaxID=2980027 RepID=A0A9E8LY28_9BACI|nr:YtpI family protein [Fervidibacillus halotolerans]WAA11674.1 YtpI family protein [Fervidibacillus halotolerans]